LRLRTAKYRAKHNQLLEEKQSEGLSGDWRKSLTERMHVLMLSGVNSHELTMIDLLALDEAPTRLAAIDTQQT